MGSDKMLTVVQVAEWLQVHPDTVKRWLRDGNLKGFRLGGNRAGWRVRESELERFVRDREGTHAD
jgi:excisionase family DNA binding protein